MADDKNPSMERFKSLIQIKLSDCIPDRICSKIDFEKINRHQESMKNSTAGIFVIFGKVCCFCCFSVGTVTCIK